MTPFMSSNTLTYTPTLQDIPILSYHRCLDLASCLKAKSSRQSLCPQNSTHHSPKLSSTSKSTLAILSSRFSPGLFTPFGCRQRLLGDMRRKRDAQLRHLSGAARRPCPPRWRPPRPT